MKSICVFCGSVIGDDPAYVEAAAQFGRALAARRLRLIYGGGSVGLMGVLADAALGAGGEVVGVIPRALWDREVGHRGLTDCRIVDTMHERKALLASMSDAFVALPGGVGTLDELFETWTGAQLGIHAKPFGLLNVRGYYDLLMRFLDDVTAHGFVQPEYRVLLMADDKPEALLDRLAKFRPVHAARWTLAKQST
ncbi:MAG: TIGR00730 family Rossman fold protein [Phycisphaerae bacterium]